jgi:hypothetical protein
MAPRPYFALQTSHEHTKKVLGKLFGILSYIVIRNTSGCLALSL